MKPLFVANWKMNMLLSEAQDFCEQFLSLYTPHSSGEADIGIAPPLTSLDVLTSAFEGAPGVMIGVQNCHWAESGAHTGEVSPQMVSELGVDFVIVGHSERRQFYGETDEGVAKRARAAIEHGLKAIVCIGESETQFDAGETAQVVKSQLTGSLAGLTAEHTPSLIVAYEPVWAIGTGKSATPDIAENVHTQIRADLLNMYSADLGEAIPLLYGGSTKPGNIEELMRRPNVEGALVGGAALKPDSFSELIINGRKGAA